MADDLKRLSDLAHSGEELLEGLLRARGDAKIDTHIGRVQRWGEELIALGETIDPNRQAYLREMIVPNLSNQSLYAKEYCRR